jgi:hypothetical protein
MREIIKRRTALEAALVRRAPRKADFLAYVAYEAQLEALRRKRAARLSAPVSPAAARRADGGQSGGARGAWATTRSCAASSRCSSAR